MADELLGLKPIDVARLAKMLRAYESGTLPGAAQKPGDAKGKKPDTVSVQIDANAPGGGKYWVKLLQPRSDDISEAGTVTPADAGEPYTPPSADFKYLLINLAEAGADTHALPLQSVHLAKPFRTQGKVTVLVLDAGGTLPTGQYKDDVYKMITQNQGGWGPVTARSMQ